MIFPFGCYSFTLTKWHDENPNDWVALGHGTYTNDLSNPKRHILYDRDENLGALRDRIKERGIEVTYGKAWGLGIGKDYPIGK